MELALDGLADMYPEPEDEVSILVFVELALDEIESTGNMINQSMFQSLFSWNLLLMDRAAIETFLETGFNPCFRGTCS